MPHASPLGGSGGASDDAWSPRATDPGPPPLALPGYRDFVPVASGGESVVYRAIQDGVNRPVAVKVLIGEAEGVPAVRYQRELEITVRLGRAHPNIVTVLDTQILPDGRPCIVMEYHELGSLQDQLRAHGPLPSSAVVAAGTVVADALAYAHREGVLHRDIKPQNILVLPTSYVLADFGLARPVDAGHTSSLERFSYRHASPQVLDGELPTVADDIYSLGSTLFTLLDGRPPFAVDEPESDSALAYLRRARSELPRPIRSSDATPDLLAIIDRCLAKPREDRFPDATTLRDALRGVVTEARVWARTWQPQAIPGREQVRDPSPARPVSPAPAAPTSPGTPGPVAPATPASTPPAPTAVPPAERTAAPVRHWTAEPPTPGSATPTPLASPGAGGTPTAPPDIPGPVTAPQPVVAPSRPHWDTPPVRDRVDPAPASDRVPPARISPQWTEEPGHDDRRSDDSRFDDGEDYSGGSRGREAGRGRAGWVRVLVLALVALLLGTVIGLGGSTLLALLSRDTGVETVPSITGLPSNATVGTPDPALAPDITELNDRGSSIELAWDDPTNGRAQFVINRIDRDRNEFVQRADSGVTRTVVADLDPDAEYCFQVVAIVVGDGFGVSETECTNR